MISDAYYYQFSYLLYVLALSELFIHANELLKLLHGFSDYLSLAFAYATCDNMLIIIIMVIFKCYFSGEHIALSIKNNNNGVNIEL